MRWSNDRKSLAVESQNKSTKLAVDPVNHIWGIPVLASTELKLRGPTDFLCSMLAWRARIPSARCPKFPSWSWSGWALPSGVDFSQRWQLDGLPYRRMAEIQLTTKSSENVRFDGLEENPEYNNILKDAERWLTISGLVIKVEFDRVDYMTLPLRPRIKGFSKDMPIFFWPNKKLNTELDLRGFTRRTWKAISLLFTVNHTFTLLVVQPIREGQMWERVGLLEIECSWETLHDKASLYDLILG
jgi:hypothetical protein